MNPLHLALVGLLLFLGLRVAHLWRVYRRIAGVVLRPPRFRVRDEAEVPAWLWPQLRAPEAALRALGFEPFAVLGVRGSDRQRPGESFDRVLYSPAGGIYAFVYVPEFFNPGRPPVVDLASFFVDGTALLTLEREVGLAPESQPGVTLQAHPELTLGRRWVRHDFAVQAAGGIRQTRRPDAGELAAELERRARGPLERAAAEGELRLAEGATPDAPSWRWPARLARRHALKAVFGGRRRSVPETEERWSAPPPPPELEVERHEELACMMAATRAGGRGLLVALVTAVLFALAMGSIVSPVMVGLLLAVAFFHEAGHFLAMRLFGYRETGIFFLPLFGAATTGRKDDATLGERALVLLAGPVPGLALGFGLAAAWPLASQPPALQTLVLLLLYLNLFNLLPILPLDGGRLLERVLFSRRPGAAVAFRVVSAACLAGVGWRFGDPLLPWIGGLVALSIPGALRLRTLGTAWTALAPGPDLLRSLYAVLAASPLRQLPLDRRFNLVRELEQRVAEPPAGRRATLGWLAAYLLCLAAAIVGLVLELGGRALLGG